MATRHVSRVGGALHEQLLLAGDERPDSHLRVIPTAWRALDRKQHGSAVRQHVRKAVVELALGEIRGRQRFGRATSVRHVPQTTASVVCEDDSAIGPPADTRRERRPTDSHDRTSRERDLLQLAGLQCAGASLPESDPLPIGREERAFGPLRSLDWRCLQSIHPPQIQLPRSRPRCGNARRRWPRCVLWAVGQCADKRQRLAVW